LLFSESLSRFVVEVSPAGVEAFEAALSGLPLQALGSVTADRFVIARDGAELVNLRLSQLVSTWRGEGAAQSAADAPTVATRRQPSTMPAVHLGQKKVAILHAKGTNRDGDAFQACQMAGAEPDIVYVNELISGKKRLEDYHMTVVPGGFSFGDDLGAGMLWAFTLRHQLGEAVERFVSDGRPLLGICNGFQVLVAMGLLPGAGFKVNGHRPVSLTRNESRRFECRWVYLQPNPRSPSLFTSGLTEMVYCPVAHGEGRLAVANQAVLETLEENNLAPLIYVSGDGSTAAYPANPNGSAGAIASLTNPAGNVMGLMPHPENHIYPWQHPRWQRGEQGMGGLPLFVNGLKNG